MKRADKSGASIAIILGEDEIAAKTATIKYLRAQQEQESLAFDQVASLLEKLI
jgi:histidyl-tRNA synthetase